MSYDDFTALIHCTFNISQLGCPIIYVVSENYGKWWDNSETAYPGWQLRDNWRNFQESLDKRMERPKPDAPDAVYQGGYFTVNPICASEDD